MATATSSATAGSTTPPAASKKAPVRKKPKSTPKKKTVPAAAGTPITITSTASAPSPASAATAPEPSVPPPPAPANTGAGGFWNLLINGLLLWLAMATLVVGAAIAISVGTSGAKRDIADKIDSSNAALAREIGSIGDGLKKVIEEGQGPVLTALNKNTEAMNGTLQAVRDGFGQVKTTIDENRATVTQFQQRLEESSARADQLAAELKQQVQGVQDSVDQQAAAYEELRVQEVEASTPTPHAPYPTYVPPPSEFKVSVDKDDIFPIEVPAGGRSVMVATRHIRKKTLVVDHPENVRMVAYSNVPQNKWTLLGSKRPEPPEEVPLGTALPEDTQFVVFESRGGPFTISIR